MFDVPEELIARLNPPEIIHVQIDEQFLANDSFDIMDAIAPVWYGVNIYDSVAEYEFDLAKFTLPQRHIFAIEWYSAEVNNGGHFQFYDNSTGIVWEDAIKGFEEIGATLCVEIIKKSTQLFGGNPSKIREERQDTLGKFVHDDNFDWSTFDELDDAFYAVDTGELDLLLRKYIKNHEKDFYYSGDVSTR